MSDIFNPQFQYNNYPHQNYDMYRQPMYNNYATPTPRSSQFITKMVTSIEEARASIIDGLYTHLFIDINSGKIYLKRINNNGLSDFFIYSIEEQKTNNPNEPFNLILNRLDVIENKLGELYANESVKNDGTTDVTTNAKSKSATIESSTTNDERKKRNGNQTNVE